MSLLVLLAGASSGSPPAPADGAAVDAQAKGETDIALMLVSPDRASRYPVPDYWEIHLVQGPKLQDTLTVTLPKSSVACSQSYSSMTALASRFEGWSFDLYVRGTLVFMGPRQRFRMKWEGRRRTGASGTTSDPTAAITIVCEHFYTRLTRDRKVYGTGAGAGTGAKFSMTDAWRDIARTLVRENMVTGAVEPTGWDTGSLDRATFGPGGVWSVTVPANDGTGSNVFAADFGDNLHDTLDELCDTPTSEADKLWPTISESGAGVFAIDFLVGRSGGSRGIGSDLSSIIVSPEMGNLAAYEVDEDGAQAGSHWQVAGKGRGGSQLRAYKSSSDAISTHGLCEDSLTIPAGTVVAELENEAQRQINERAAGSVTHTLTLVETPTFLWPTNFGIKDTLTVHTPLAEATETSPSGAQKLQLLIIGVEWKKTGPRPPELRLIFGRWPTIESRRQGRSGGGGSGGRGGGGRPRGKAGDPETDPDEIFAFKTVKADDGNSAIADTHADQLDILRADSTAVVRAYTTAADDPEIIRIKIEGDYVATPIDGTGHVKMNQAGGGYIWLSATTTDPGGG